MRKIAETIFLIILILLVTVSCNEDEPEVLVATSIDVISGDNQSAEIETELTKPIVLMVKDQNGEDFSGAIVNFLITEGTISASSDTTDQNGTVSINWTLSATIGTQTLTVTAFNANGATALTGSPITITAMGEAPLEATSIEVISGKDQVAMTETTLAEPIVVIVRDQNGKGFEGTSINFEVTEGSVSSATITTDNEGRATITWTLGTTVGNQTLTATAFKSDGTSALNNSPLSIHATAAPTNVTDVDNNTYSIVIIGKQIWMAENLKVTHYDNSGIQGEAIQLVDSDETWAALEDNNTSKAYCWYDDDEATNRDIYGALYTYSAATNGTPQYGGNPVQGVCPTGWHLPSISEWDQLIEYLGGSWVAGGKMKETGFAHWNFPNTDATNSSGFTALPGGDRAIYGTCTHIGEYAYWWSSTEEADYSACFRAIRYDEASVHMGYTYKHKGFSVRCIMD